MKYLVFDTKTQADAANDTIFSTAMPLYQAQGYQVDGSGLIGKADGVDAFQASRTTAWDIPKQRLDGKWVVAHPESHSAATTILPGGSLALDIIMAALGAVVVETRDAAWFAQVIT